ncbi:MAG: FIG00636535: hypothetical protein, partial [uncultured Sphingosinicella sp.]
EMGRAAAAQGRARRSGRRGCDLRADRGQAPLRGGGGIGGAGPQRRAVANGVRRRGDARCRAGARLAVPRGQAGARLRARPAGGFLPGRL